MPDKYLLAAIQLVMSCSELYFARCWNIRIGKQGCVFILTDFKKQLEVMFFRCFYVSFLTSISVSKIILGVRKIDFLK